MSVRVHRCRFLDYDRPSVTALAFNDDSTNSDAPEHLRLSVCRSNGDIEVWNPFTWVPEFVIPGSKGRTIEDVCWVRSRSNNKAYGGRIFTVGGADAITEWSLLEKRPQSFTRSDAGVIWAIAANPEGTRLAAATDTGVVVVYDCSNDSGSEPLTPLQRHRVGDASLASLCWLSNGLIAAGAVDGSIRVWDTSRGAAGKVTTLSVDKPKELGEEVVVWAVKLLPLSNQLVSADSNGCIKFWDINTLLLQQSLQAHEGDVLCLALSSNGRSVFSAGLDQKIVHTQLTDLKSRRWTVMSSAVAHTNDVRCMVSFEAQNMAVLVSGGLDQSIVVGQASSPRDKDKDNHGLGLSLDGVMEKKFKKLTYSLPKVTASNEFVVTWYEQQVKLWRIGEEPELKAVLKLANEEFITSASFDAETKLLAVSTSFETRLFTVSDNEVVPVPCKFSTGARFVSISGHTLITVGENVVVFDLSTEIQKELQGAHEEDMYADTTFIASNASRLAVASPSHIEIFDLKSLQFVDTLPGTANATAAAFRDDKHLVVAYADKSVLEFDTETCLLTSWSRLNMSRMPHQLLEQSEPAFGVFCLSSSSSRVWLWGPSWLATIDMHSKTPLRSSGGVVVEDARKTDDLPHFSLTKQYKPFFASNIGSQVLVCEPQEKRQVSLKPFFSFRRINL